MRILCVCHDHPAFTAGGTEILAKNLADRLDQEPGTSAWLLAATTALSRPEALPGSLEQFGRDFLLRTGGYDSFGMARQDGTVWTETLADLVSRLEPDVVHLHGLDRIGTEIVTFLRTRFPRLPIVLSLHDYQLICPNEGLLLRRNDGALCHEPSPDGCRRCFPEHALARHALRATYLRTVLGQIDAFIAPSHFLARRFADWGVPSARIRHIANAAPGHWDPQPGLTRLRRDRFAYFGNLAPHKGIEVLLHAASQLQLKGAELRINVHGDLLHPSNRARSNLERALRDAAPMVQHLGPYSRQELPALMTQTDWVVLPALWFENAPLTVLEAQKFGKPVICTPLGGLPELVHHGIDGLHVPRGDARALAETMVAAAENDQLWQQLATNVRSGPSFDSFTDAHRHVFSEVLSMVSV